ncbi:MAG: trypsin-like peptidase domain-containing protein [Myxococcales bacterium]|nr:trypsin-like peptidase domain-containing protein [Myxococcales bacterium]
MFEPSVVRIDATCLRPDHDAPWQSKTPRSGNGSGVVIAPGRVLTGAHVVADATFVQVQTVRDPTRYTSRVIGVCHDADLALLAVDDSRFGDTTAPATLREGLPQLRDQVSVLGFPVGGEEVSVTAGVVSRIEVQRYTHSQRRLLAVTVDAAINDGNSGGPVFCDGEVVGIAFQSLTDAENIGEVVPTVLVRQFLKGVEQSKTVDVPSLSIETQSGENPTLRRSLGLTEPGIGVLVRQVHYGGSAHGVLRVGDVLLEIGGHPIAANGTIRYADRIRTRFEAVLGEHFVGDRLSALILRDGTQHSVSMELKAHRRLVPYNTHDRHPRYVVWGGLVFQPLTRDVLRTWDRWWQNAPAELLEQYTLGVRTVDCRERILLSQVLADELTIGFRARYHELVTAVNGVLPRDLAHLAEIVDAAEGLVTFETSWGGRLVFDSEQVAQNQARILERYRIPQARSTSLDSDP